MKASDLNTTIEIWQANTTRTYSGSFEIEYEYKCRCRARVNYSTGNRIVDNEELFYTVDRTFFVRHYIPVVDTDQIRWDGKKWQIHSIDHNREFKNIVINCTLINE